VFGTAAASAAARFQRAEYGPDHNKIKSCFLARNRINRCTAHPATDGFSRELQEYS
jgi:hypothetical protein